MKNEHGWARLVMKIMARGGMRLNKTKELRTNALTVGGGMGVGGAES